MVEWTVDNHDRRTVFKHDSPGIILLVGFNRKYSTSASPFLACAEQGATVKPVLSGPVLNGHPLLSGQL